MYIDDIRKQIKQNITQTVAEYLRVVTTGRYKDDVIIIAPRSPRGQKRVNIEKIPTSSIYSFDDMPISEYLAAAVELFDAAFKALPIDTDRVYGYGNSMCAFATFYLACAYPELYAAIVPVAGGCDPTKASLIKDIPMWVFHGNADKTVDIAGFVAVVENVLALGAKDARLTVFEGVGHHATQCFVAAARTQDLVEWMFSHSNKAK